MKVVLGVQGFPQQKSDADSHSSILYLARNEHLTQVKRWPGGGGGGV